MEENNTTIITSVVAHIDHGKTSLVDSLVATQGRISKSMAGMIRFLDTREDEQRRGITLKLSAINLNYNGVKHIIIDTPGHVDLESLIQSSSILSDNFLVLVDINEGITPRTYTLVNYIKGKGCVLAINKTDKLLTEEDLLSKSQTIISSMNALIGEEVFSWKDNNVILCCATYCYGINNYLLEKITGRKCGLKTAIKFIFQLRKKIETNDVDNICQKYKIKHRNMKNIFSTVLPLAECVFNSIKRNFFLIKKNEKTQQLETDLEDINISSQNISNGEKIKENKKTITKFKANLKPLMESNLINLYPKFYGDSVKYPNVLGITACGILKENLNYDKNSLLFVTRLFYGSITTGDTLYSLADNKMETCTIEKIYKFGINEFIEVESATGSDLICIKSKFLRNSIISDIPTHFLEVENKMKPFFKSKIVLANSEQLDDIKSVFRTMSYVEQCLKVKINKYGEIEIMCTGKVHFEKILSDLTLLGFQYEVGESNYNFVEYATKEAYEDFKLDDDLNLHVKIKKIMNQDLKKNETGNIFSIKASEHSKDIINNVLEIFVLSGPLIRENIKSTYFEIELIGESFSVNTEELYALTKNSLTSVYHNTSPTIAPMFYNCKISIQQEFIGMVYLALSKFIYVIESEEYEDSTGFHILNVKIPQFMYADFVEELRIKSKGTAYIVPSEGEIVYDLDFDKYVVDLRKKKGMFIDEKIIEEPSKQRTYKK